MTHIRRQIREALAAKFLVDTPAIFKVVEADRVHALDFKKMLPCLEVEFLGEEIQARAMRDQGKIRTMQFGLRLTAATIALQNKLDELAERVENRIGADRTLGGLVMSIMHSSTDPDMSAEAETRIGSLLLTYTVAVVTPEDNASIRA